MQVDELPRLRRANSGPSSLYGAIVPRVSEIADEEPQEIEPVSEIVEVEDDEIIPVSVLQDSEIDVEDDVEEASHAILHAPASQGTMLRRLSSEPIIVSHGSQSTVDKLPRLRRANSGPSSLYGAIVPRVSEIADVESQEIELVPVSQVSEIVAVEDDEIIPVSVPQGTILRRLSSEPIIVSHGSQLTVDELPRLRRAYSGPSSLYGAIVPRVSEIVDVELQEIDPVQVSQVSEIVDVEPPEIEPVPVSQVSEIVAVEDDEIIPVSVPQDTLLRRQSSGPAIFTRGSQSESEPIGILRRSHSGPIIEMMTSSTRSAENPEIKKTWWQMAISYHKILSICICFLSTLAVSYLNALPAQMIGINNVLARLSNQLIRGKYHTNVNNFCAFYDVTVLVVTASCSLAQPIAVLVTPPACARIGRKKVLIGSLLWMIAGIVFILWFPNRTILVFGLTLLHFGIGVNSRVIPMIQQEVSQDKWSYLCDIASVVGGPICIAMTSFISTNKWAWRISFGALGCFLLFILFLSFLMSESPLYLIQKKNTKKALQILSSIEGNEKMWGTFGKLLIKNEKMRKSSYSSLLAPSNRPSLLIGLFSKIAALFSIVGVLQFYGPLLFKSAGKTTEASYLPPILISIIQILFRLFPLITVKRYGRRRLVITATGLRLFSEVFLTIYFYGTSNRFTYFSYPLLLLVPGAIYVAADASMTSPTGWLDSAFPDESNEHATTLLTAFGLLQNTIMGSVSVIVFCKLNFSIFVPFILLDFFVVLLFIFYLVPETTGKKIAEVWGSHPVWGRYVKTAVNFP
ncbi:hypothetical protein RND81_02G081400 [Saponaria officinalis]|uniref:Major facilitator superfamily (MFS) profile domain-containing protein n=1 Tax=Saponaria officinalis TaxID=3572 RepID=A0AAW1MWQ9_SAPOF